MTSPDILPSKASVPILRELWRDVSAGMERATADETTVIAVKNITWRSSESKLQDWMPALVSLVISPPAGKAAFALLKKQLELRDLWMQHGGPIFTTDGNRRKRKYVGDEPERVSELRGEINRLSSLYRKVARGREGGLITAMAVLSGAIYSSSAFSGETDRRTARGSLSYMFGRLPRFTKIAKSVIGGVSAPPFGRKLR